MFSASLEVEIRQASWAKRLLEPVIILACDCGLRLVAMALINFMFAYGVEMRLLPRGKWRRLGRLK